LDKLRPMPEYYAWTKTLRDRGLQHIQKGLFAYILLAVAGVTPAFGDNISPKLDQSDTTYTMEQPDKGFYGTGIASRATEAFELRCAAERDLQGGRVHDAVRKARKAAQFDPSSADSHLVLARTLTACLKAEGFQDKEMYSQCVKEWRLLRWHD